MDAVTLSHGGVGIEVQRLGLLELLLNLVDAVGSTTTVLSGFVAHNRQCLYKHTDDVEHATVGTSVVDRCDEDVIFACSTMEHLQEHGEEIVASGDGMLAAEGIDGSAFNRDGQFRIGHLLLRNFCFRRVGVGCGLYVAEQCVEIGLCLLVLLRLHASLLVQRKVESRIGFLFQVETFKCCLYVIGKDKARGSVEDDMMEVTEQPNLVAVLIDFQSVQMVVQQVEGVYLALEERYGRFFSQCG